MSCIINIRRFAEVHEQCLFNQVRLDKLNEALDALTERCQERPELGCYRKFIDLYVNSMDWDENGEPCDPLEHVIRWNLVKCGKMDDECRYYEDVIVRCIGEIEELNPRTSLNSQLLEKLNVFAR